MHDNRLYTRWILANGIGEVVGLGGTALVGWLMFTSMGDDSSAVAVIGMALALIAAGVLFEGVAVGVLQGRVLNTYVPAISVAAWARATALGAGIAWTLGMVPSTMMGVSTSATGDASAQEPGALLMYLMAAFMGAALGPILGIPQWRVLREHLPRAGRWIWANSLAWAFGMPVIFAGIDVAASGLAVPAIVAVITATFLLTGLVVGAIHGKVLVRMVKEGELRIMNDER